MSGDLDADTARAWLEEEGFDLSALQGLPTAASAGDEFIPDLDSYDIFCVAFSGGKDSLAALLRLLDLGVPREKIELHHHLVDGEGPIFMDWPVSESYCRAIAAAFGVSITFSWREGGLRREPLRNNAPTAPAWIPAEGGGHRPIGGKGPLGTRLRFPQVSADLGTRWCSSYLKIGIFASYLANHSKFLGKRTLVVTGERAQESRARANYKVFEPHRGDTRDSKRVPRHIDHLRIVHAWSEQQVWNIIERYRGQPHPAYVLGWGRLSCRLCIFGGKDQWASSREIAPAEFNDVAQLEREFKVTIHRKHTVVERANAGTPYEMHPQWIALANSREFDYPVFVDPWVMPKGAFGEACGPT